MRKYGKKKTELSGVKVSGVDPCNALRVKRIWLGFSVIAQFKVDRVLPDESIWGITRYRWPAEKHYEKECCTG
jgi:hypothetical protein